MARRPRKWVTHSGRSEWIQGRLTSLHISHTDIMFLYACFWCISDANNALLTEWAYLQEMQTPEATDMSRRLQTPDVQRVRLGYEIVSSRRVPGHVVTSSEETCSLLMLTLVSGVSSVYAPVFHWP